MAGIDPFRALRYDAAQVDLGRVIAPPYDVVAREERQELFDRDPHNAVRLELTRRVEEETDTDYAHVRETLDAWGRTGILVRDETPALYVLRQSFKAPDGRRLSRDGFFAALRLEDYEAGIVRPHERTLAGPKADRLRVLRATRANLSPVFMLYEDREEDLAGVLSDALLGDDVVHAHDAAGVQHSLAALHNESAVGRVRDFLADLPLVIADGHHRYETALAYRDERRAAAGQATGQEPYDAILVYLANAFAPGSLLLPIHRVIKEAAVPAAFARGEGLDGWSSKSVALPGESAIEEALEEHLAPHAGKPSFAADDGAGRLQIFWRDEDLGERLMVRILEDEIMGGIFGFDADAIRDGAVGFPKSALQAAREVRSGRGTLAFYLLPVRPEDVFRVSAAGQVMPQKSTFFAPKIPTGLVFRDEEAP